MLVGLAGVDEFAASLGIAHRFHLFKNDARELAAFVGEFFGHEVIEDRNVLVHGVVLFPGGRLHVLEAGADDHFHIFTAEPAGRPAAIHGGVAAAEHNDALADLVDVTEGDAGEPVDADVNVLCRFLAAGDVEIAAARRAAAHEDRVKVLRQQRPHTVDALAAAEFDAEVENVTAFFVDHAFRQTEFRDLRAHHPAGQRILVEHRALVTHWREVARNGKRSGAAAHERNAFAVFACGRLRQAIPDIVLEVSGYAFQAADRDRLFLHTAAPASGLAGTITSAAEHAGKDVRMPIDHVGVAVAARRDQADVFGDGRMRGARPLTIYDLMEVVRS